MVLFTMIPVMRMWYRACDFRCRTVRVKNCWAISQLLNYVCIMQQLVTWPPSFLNPSIGTSNVSGCGCFFTILKTVIITKCWHECFWVCVWSLSNIKKYNSTKSTGWQVFLFTFLHYYGKRCVLHMYVHTCILNEIYNQGGKTKWLGCGLCLL